MTIEKSLQRLHWRISKGNFTPNENDIEAVNFLVDWVNQQKTKELQENRLFAKLYIVHFGELLTHFQDIDFAQNELHKILSDPLTNHIEWFRMKLNQHISNQFHKSIGLSEKPYYFLSDEEAQQEEILLKENAAEFLENLNKWPIEKVTKSLENQLTEAINKFKNYD